MELISKGAILTDIVPIPVRLSIRK